MRAALWGLLAAAALAGCRSTIEYNPVDRDQIVDRAVLTMPTSPMAPLPKELVGETEAAFERTLRDSQYLTRILPAADYLATLSNQYARQEQFRIVADSLSVLRLADREYFQTLQKQTDVDLLGMVQVLDLRCPGCDQGSRVGLIAALYDARTARLLWRIHLTEDIPDAPGEEDYRQAVDALNERMVRMLERLLAPKWHRARFANLKLHHGTS